MRWEFSQPQITTLCEAMGIDVTALHIKCCFPAGMPHHSSLLPHSSNPPPLQLDPVRVLEGLHQPHHVFGDPPACLGQGFGANLGEGEGMSSTCWGKA